MYKNYKVIFYYKEGEQVYYIEDKDENNTLRKMSILDINNPDLKLHSFKMLGKDYTKCHKDLIKYKKEFNKETNEIFTEKIKTPSGKTYNLDYTKYFNHSDAVLYYFMSKVNKDILSRIEKPTEDEFYIMERCYNAGLITLNLKYKNKKTQCFGYDYSRYYTHLLLDMNFSTKRGKIETLNKLDYDNVKFGIYRIKITYKKEEFTNIFTFSKFHHYASSTIKYLIQIKDKYGLEFELLPADEKYDYNALTYDNEYLINGKEIFGDWYKSLENIRKKYPKNSILKHMMSSLWGMICSFKRIYVSEDNIEDYDISHLKRVLKTEYKILDIDKDYIIVKSDDAYNHSLARLKPFMSSLGRLKIMRLLIDSKLEENIVRIHTDGIVLNKEVNFKELKKNKYNYYPSPEDKTTGIMVYENAVFGFHVCQNCHEKNPYKKHIKHIKKCSSNT